MANVILRAVLAAGVLFSLAACSSSQFPPSCESGANEPQPKWVSKLDYSEADYYVGVGSSEKLDASARQAESEASAKRALVEHINVRIKSDNEQSTSVSNAKVSRDEVSKITVSADENLRGLKTKSRWLDKDRCTLFTLVVVSKKSVEESNLEKIMKIRFEKFKILLADGIDRHKNPDINDRRKNLEDAQGLLLDTDFARLPEENRKPFYEQQLKDAFAAISQEISQAKDRMALFVLNKDHTLNDGVIGKMVDLMREESVSTDRLMEHCEQEQECIRAAHDRAFTKLTILVANCQVETSQMGSLKGRLTVTKKIYDLASRKMLDGSSTRSAEVIGWSSDELDWNAAAEKVIRGFK